MLTCRGKGCLWRRVCSRYVVGRVAGTADVCGEQMDHCLRHQDKFVAVNSEEGRRMSEKLKKAGEWQEQVKK